MNPTNKGPTGTNFSGMLPSGQKQFALNPTEFDNLIKAHGVQMIHSKPIPCPNIRDIYAKDHDPNCTLCHNQMVYYAHKKITAAILGNSLAKQFLPQGSFDIDQATVVVPAKYDDGTELDVQVFDRLQICGNITVRYYQRVQHSQTGIDRLHFPAESVDLVMGSDGHVFEKGVDYTVNADGCIEWISSKRPGFDLMLGKGRVYSVNYFIRPVLTVINLPHQLRITQTIQNGVAVQERFPQLAVVQKDFFPVQPGDIKGQSDTGEPQDGQV